jgi:hypothetical protein
VFHRVESPILGPFKGIPSRAISDVDFVAASIEKEPKRRLKKAPVEAAPEPEPVPEIAFEPAKVERQRCGGNDSTMAIGTPTTDEMPCTEGDSAQENEL